MSEVLAALLPGWRGDPLPPEFPLHVRLALRLSVVVALLAALWLARRPFSWLDRPGQEAVLEALAHHRWASLRGLVAWWKLVAMVTRC